MLAGILARCEQAKERTHVGPGTAHSHDTQSSCTWPRHADDQDAWHCRPTTRTTQDQRTAERQRP
eukprot:2585684-Alexandrium_andersonii.AAC.1